MSVTLPASPAPMDFDVFMVGNEVDQTPPMGGVTSRLSRLGDRFGVSLRYPPMNYVDAMAWFAALALAKNDTMLVPVTQPEFTIGAPGAPLVNGGGQAGMSLNTDGWSAAYAAKAGQFIGIVGASRRYLHMFTADKAATGGGVMAAAPLWPMLRVAPADNAVLEVAAPKLEGWVQGNRQQWTVNRIMATGLQFDVVEGE